MKTFNTYKAFPQANSIYRLNKISGKYFRDITNRELEKCKKDCIVFKGTDSINEKLVYVLQLKGDPKTVKNKIIKFNLYMLAHNGSGFDSSGVLKILSQCRTVVSLIKNGPGIVSLKIFDG